MTRKLYLPLLLCLPLIHFFACKKDGVDCNGKSSLPAAIGRYEATFDGAGNLTKLYQHYPAVTSGPFQSPAFSETYDFLRSGSEILLSKKVDFFDGNPGVFINTLQLDLQGRCTQSIGTDTIRFSYTGDGYLEAMYFTSFGVPDTGRFEYQNGNLLRYTSLNLSFDFEYSTDLDDSPWHFQNVPVEFNHLDWVVFLSCFGKKNKNMLTKATLTSSFTGTSVQDYSYAYDPCSRLERWGTYTFKYSD